jgi:hypothetical protein
MKRAVLNRKNSLLVGNPRGGKTVAILASLTSTCRRLDIDPQVYFTQLLVNLPHVRMRELANWPPDRWKSSQAERLAELRWIGEDRSRTPCRALWIETDH